MHKTDPSHFFSMAFRESSQAVLFRIAERVASACLRLDPASRERLKALSGKRIALHWRDPLPAISNTLTVFICIQESGIEINAEDPHVMDAALSITTRDIPTLLASGPMPNSIPHEGDSEVLNTLREILSQIDIDWESALARAIGDVPAHFLADQTRKTSQWVYESTVEAKRLATEYFEEEWPTARENFQRLHNGATLDKIRTASSDFWKGWTGK